MESNELEGIKNVAGWESNELRYSKTVLDPKDKQGETSLKSGKDDG
jgi:hypothetical protein